MRTQRIVEMATRRYDLNETQKTMARGEIEQMEAQRHAAMGAAALEYDRLQEEVFRIWSGPQPDGADTSGGRDRWRGLRDDPRFAEIRKRMREIERKFPLDWEAALKRVETLLPPEQVERARQRGQERSAALAAARQQRRARQPDRSNDAVTPGPGREGSNRPQGTGAGRSAATNALQPGAHSESDPLKRDAAEAERARAAASVHPWEQYVKKFIAEHELTDAQANAALAILKDARTRAGQIEKASAERIAAARQIPDRSARDKRLAELNQPVDRLFDELKQRLDSLLTAAQRAKANSKIPS